MKSRPFIAAMFVVVCALALLAAAPQYKVVKHYPFGGEGGWDYIKTDSASRRVYIGRATRIMVVDADSGKLIGEVPDVQGAHGAVAAPELGRGFATAGRASQVVVFDLKTLKVTGTVPTGEGPDDLLYHPATKRVWVFNGRSKSATVIDAASLKVVATIPLPGRPEAAAADERTVFVEIVDKNTIASLDARDLKITQDWPTAPCEEPTGLDFDAKKGRLYAGCGNKVMAVMDSKNGKVLGSVPIGAGCDGTVFDPAVGYAFASAGRDGNVTVVGETSPGKFEAVQTVPTQVSGRTIAIDDKTHQLFIPAAKLQPPAAPGQRPTMEPGSFELVVVGR
ncbi:MAG: YncE family protein [Terriglobales bacterium]